MGRQGGQKTKASDFVHILSCDHILTNLMLSKIVSALTAFTIHAAFTLFPKFLQRFETGRYIPRAGVSKFLGLLLHTASAPGYPQI